MPEASAVGRAAAQAAARGGCCDEEPGADIRFEHLSGGAEHYSCVSRTGPRYGADDDSHVFRRRGETDSGAAAGSDDVRADADRISAGKVRADQAAAGERGRVPGQLRKALEGLSVSR